MKYNIVKDLLGIKIYKLNMEDETENKAFKMNTFVELTDEELEERIKEYKMQGYEVETYHQEFKWKKLRNIQD